MNSPLDSLVETQFEKTESRSGAMAIAWQGRLLCSSRDPILEAKRWAEAQAHEAAKEVIVLGLGAGYHIEALQELRPEQKILVLDFHPSLIQQFEFQNVRTQAAVVSMDKNQERKELIQKRVPVLKFRPAWAGLENHYEDLFAELTGQTPQALLWQAEISQAYVLSKLLGKRDIGKNIPLITIKEIEALVAREPEEKETRLWQALRELVR